MLTISDPLTAQKASTYFAKDDYYLAGAGTWWGNGAETLGLSGEVNRETFEAVLRKTDPRTGETLVAGKGRTDPAGIDGTFRAPEGTSIHALGKKEAAVRNLLKKLCREGVVTKAILRQLPRGETR